MSLTETRTRWATYEARRLARKYWPGHGCRIVVRRQTRGYARLRSKRISIPLWVMEKSTPKAKRPMYTVWYICHELAHIKANSHRHDKAFYEALVELCPQGGLIHELRYKPRAARAAGIHNVKNARRETGRPAGGDHQGQAGA